MAIRRAAAAVNEGTLSWAQQKVFNQLIKVRIRGWKRNKKVAIKLLLSALTVLHLELGSPTHHRPSCARICKT